MGDRDTLVVVSGYIPDDLRGAIERGERPRADYCEIAAKIDADVVDVRSALAATGLLGRGVSRFGGAGALMGWYSFRHRRDYSVIVTDGEHVGLLFAALCRLFGRRGSRHVMVVHVVSTRTKSAMVRLLRLAPLIDAWIVYCSWQRDYVQSRFGVSPGRVHLTTFMVDTTFFSPTRSDEHPGRKVCAVGLERRDYPTLMKAVEGLDVEIVIAAASPWSRQPDSTEGHAIPDNVTVRSFSQAELRPLYASSAFSVMPLQAVDFQAGVTAILESMAMARPVICTATRGQNDVIVDGETGRYVAPADPVGLREAIVQMIDDPLGCTRMGRDARRWILEHADIEVYAERLAAVVRPMLDGTAG